MFFITTVMPLPNNLFSLDGNIMAVSIIFIPIQVWKKRIILPGNISGFLGKGA